MKFLCLHLNQIGDLAFSLPALKCIRDSFPGSSITSVVRPGGDALLAGSGLVDEVLLRKSGFNLDKAGLVRQLVAGHYDVAVVFSQSAECAALAYLSRAPRRVGFINTSLGMLLTERVDFAHPPSTENNLRLVRALGCEPDTRDYAGLLTPTSEQVESTNTLLAGYGVASTDPIAVLSPGTSGRRSVKEWTDEGFAAVGRHLIDKGLKVLAVGTEPAVGIVNACSEIIDISGHTKLGQLLAVLARCQVLVAVDSGVLHLCAAAAGKVVGLYGPSNHQVTGPQGKGHVVVRSEAECSPCVRTECKLGRKCMLDLKVEQVIAAVDQVLA